WTIPITPLFHQLFTTCYGIFPPAFQNRPSRGTPEVLPYPSQQPLSSLRYTTHRLITNRYVRLPRLWRTRQAARVLGASERRTPRGAEQKCLLAFRRGSV